MASIEAIPDEIVAHILAFIPLKELAPLRLVCQRFSAIASSITMWKLKMNETLLSSRRFISSTERHALLSRASAQGPQGYQRILRSGLASLDRMIWILYSFS